MSEGVTGLESPDFVRTSLAGGMTLGFIPGKFFRDAKSYCLNLLLTYKDGCAGRCAYCGLSRTRLPETPWSERSFIRVDWPAVRLDDVVDRLASGACSDVERVCVSMVTNGRARSDTITVVKKIGRVFDGISVLITPTIVDRSWLKDVRNAGADMVGVAIDAATPAIFDALRGKGVGGPHRWNRYWRILEDAVEVFGRYNAGAHLIVGLGERELDMVNAIQRAQDLGASTHLFSFFPEEKSPMENFNQPPIGQYRRIQLARYVINKGIGRAEDMRFDERGRIIDFGLDESKLNEIIESGAPFMTSGCRSKNREGACNRPYSNSTPYQALIGEIRNYPFQPTPDDIKIIKIQLLDYSDIPVKRWLEAPELVDEVE